MNKTISITYALITAAILCAGSSSIVAGTTTPAATPAANTFPERKAKILKHISDRITKMQQIQSCVEAANDFKTMHACKPHKDKHHDEK